MRKKVLFVAILAAFACAGIWQANRVDNSAALSELATSNVEALANPKPTSADCINGCVDLGPGCFCNGKHPHYDEYDWGR